MTYTVPLKEISCEIKIVNSHFIATLAPAITVEAAREFIAHLRAKYRDASHNVPAYLIGGGSTQIAHASDDGEPSGTAGRPALAVLQGSGLGDVVVVVTRYFGGTKLGTGGLVRAYTQAVQLVVEKVTRGRKVLTHSVMLAIPYKLLERLRLLAAAHQGVILDETYTADITVSIQIPVEDFKRFQSGLQELSAGQVQAEIIETNEVLMPLVSR